MGMIEQMREQIASSDVESARDYVRMALRRAIRKEMYDYSEKNYILDFDDSTLVEQRHRDYRDNLTSVGTNKNIDINNATTIAELLTIFDSITLY